MGLRDITRAGVLAAMDEYQSLGRDVFLERYGFAPAVRYVIVQDGWRYPSKAIAGAAHGFDLPKSGALKPDQFSGGERTVVKRLTELGFTVLDEVPRHRVYSGGSEIDATFELERIAAGWAVTILSRGGSKSSEHRRNSDYTQGLTRLIDRLSSLRATITSISVDSTSTSHLSRDERELAIDMPMVAEEIVNTETCVDSIGRAQAQIGRSPGAKGAGNRTRRLRIEFSLPDASSEVALLEVLTGRRSHPTRVFVLTWNPERTVVAQDVVDAEVAATAAGRSISGRWSTGNRNSGIAPGDGVVLFRQISDRGIVARGVATSAVFEAPHWDPDREPAAANYVNVSWSTVVDARDRLAVDELARIAPNTTWDAILSSGIELREPDASAVWRAFGLIASAAEESRTPEEIEVDGAPPGEITEGALTRTLVNRYERSPQGRRACIDHYGCTCYVCDLDFESVYGEIGRDFIHVHHLVPLAQIKANYVLDPVADLRPVCPNCHAMLHRGVKTPRDPEELRRAVSQS